MWQLYSSVCGLSYAFQNLVVKGVTGEEVDAKLVLWFMFASAVPFLFLYYWFFADPTYTPMFPWYLGAGVGLNLLGFYGYVRAIELADVSLVAPLLSLSPLFMLLTSWLMVSEVPDTKGLIGILFVVVGTYFLAGGERSLELEPLRRLVENPGTRWALLVSFVWSISANLDKLTVEASSALAYPFWFHITFFLAFTPIYLIMKKSETLSSITSNSGIVLAGLVATGLLQAVMVAAQMFALTKTNVTYVIAIKRAGMLVSVLGGGFFFEEKELPRRFFAALLVLFGLLGIMFR
jgi:drug/metabolite transporter (DMT)-like permease